MARSAAVVPIIGGRMRVMGIKTNPVVRCRILKPETAPAFGLWISPARRKMNQQYANIKTPS